MIFTGGESKWGAIRRHAARDLILCAIFAKMPSSCAKAKMSDMIFKILTIPQWETLQATGEFAGSADDKRDGFVHLSTGAQIQGTLDKHYTFAKTGGDDLVIAAFDPKPLQATLKYETSRGGQKFPHLYSALIITALTNHWRLQRSETDGYDAPDIITKLD